MKTLTLFLCVILLLTYKVPYSQNCNPKIHVDYLKKNVKGKVIKEFLLDFKKDSITTYKVKLKTGKSYVISFGTKGKSNQGIIVSLLRNGTYIKRGRYDAEADVQFPIRIPVPSNANYTIIFSYLKDYIQDYCAGAILIEY